MTTESDQPEAQPDADTESLGSTVSDGGATDPQVGRRIGQYRIKSVLASGGMGTVSPSRVCCSGSIW